MIHLSSAMAAIFNQEKFNTHLRWNLEVPKDQFFIVKTASDLKIETINLELFEKLVGELSALNLDKDYISKVNFSKENFPAKPATISLNLKDPSVELFSFYRDADKKYILDFWINSDAAPMKEVKIPKLLSPPKNSNLENEAVKLNDELPKKLIASKGSLLPIVEVTQEDASQSLMNPGYRDFRYGANFVWDYDPMIPALEKDINLASKIPDYLYPIQDRANLDDPKEAHMQLSINFYRDEKWGLMNKSITLYENKYGRDANLVMNEFLKANSLLRTNLAKPSRGLTQSAMNLLSNVKDLTEDYEQKSAILRYLIQYNVDQKDYVKTLELAKQLFVSARAEFDQTIVIQASLTILHCLSELKQIDKIQEFLSDKKLLSILPAQMGFAYKTYALLSKGNTKDLLKEYKELEKSLVKPIHPAILFNVAESYFRTAEYDSALRIFDEFVDSYSYLLKSPHARLRMALIYELTDKPIAENLVLYKNAIDRSTAPDIRYEAKIRYVATRIGRKLNPDAGDLETEVFLEQSPDETKAFNKNLSKLLWLTRLRIFISKKEFDKALTYLATIPLDSVHPTERRVYEGDGAEIIFGLIQEAYLKEDYAKVVKTWEVFKDKYETKVAKNAYMNYVVCDSYIKLGLFKSYDRAIVGLKSARKHEERNFPIWVERTRAAELDQLLNELEVTRLVADKDWKAMGDKLSSLPVSERDSASYYFQNGMLLYNQKKYAEAVVEFEKLLVRKDPRNSLTPRQTADLLMTYVESLYQLKNQDRFKTVVKALVGDIEKSKSAQILNVSERVHYLLIETYVGEDKDWVEVEKMSKIFNEKFQKSPYNMRVKYLYGLSLLKNSKLSEGREVLTNLLKDKEVPSHIKEMCRSELTTLELRGKNI